MIIRNLEYVNYRGLKPGRMDFDSRLTVVVGKNGSGKCCGYDVPRGETVRQGRDRDEGHRSGFSVSESV